MIRITVYCGRSGECTGFKAKGHAGYAKSGEDVVCAAVSMLVINTVNGIHAYTEDNFSLASDEKEGEIVFRAGGKVSEKASLLLKTMVLGLEAVAKDEDYKKYIQLRFEEARLS